MGASRDDFVKSPRWIRLFCDYGARIEIVYLEPPPDVLRDQNRRREGRVPERVVERLLGKVEVPTWKECHGRTLLESAEDSVDSRP